MIALLTLLVLFLLWKPKPNHSAKELNKEQGKYVYYWRWKK
jgi:hypothetical protein